MTRHEFNKEGKLVVLNNTAAYFKSWNATRQVTFIKKVLRKAEELAVKEFEFLRLFDIAKKYFAGAIKKPIKDKKIAIFIESFLRNDKSFSTTFKQRILRDEVFTNFNFDEFSTVLRSSC